MKSPVIYLLILCGSVLSWSRGRYGLSPPNRGRMVRNRRIRMNFPVHKDCMYNMCEQVANYPEEEIEKIIENNSALHSYFGGSVIEPDRMFSISSRYNGDRPTPVCNARQAVVVPRIMMDFEDNAERLIPNVQRYSQVLQFQLCDLEDEQGFPFIILENHRYECVQKFRILKLLTVNVHTRQLEHKKFRIPSHCSVEYTETEF